MHVHVLLNTIVDLSVHACSSQFVYNYMTEDHPERATHVHVAKADKICAGHDSLAMRKKSCTCKLCWLFSHT